MSVIDRVAAFLAHAHVEKSHNTLLMANDAKDGHVRLNRDDLESLLADARRYQFLRDDFKFLPIQLYESTVWQPIYTPLRLVGPTADEAIDAAMEQPK